MGISFFWCRYFVRCGRSCWSCGRSCGSCRRSGVACGRYLDFAGDAAEMRALCSHLRAMLRKRLHGSTLYFHFCCTRAIFLMLRAILWQLQALGGGVRALFRFRRRCCGDAGALLSFADDAAPAPAPDHHTTTNFSSTPQDEGQFGHFQMLDLQVY